MARNRGSKVIVNDALEEFFNLDDDAQVFIVNNYKMQQSIRNRMDYLKSELKSVNASIKALQEECTHIMAKKTPRSDPGYDPSQDCAWIEYDCPHCDKHWTEDL